MLAGQDNTNNILFMQNRYKARIERHKENALRILIRAHQDDLKNRTFKNAFK